jgi:NAD(P)-dependent dehydrogenase (short-subunit alcohol dehydrogenase family)
VPRSEKLSWRQLDVQDEDSISSAAAAVRRSVGDLHLVIITTGILHDAGRLQPEKSWRTISGTAMELAFRVNTVGPALVAKHFLPLLAADRKSVLAALSARIGSIEDNRLGGWHSYRVSKAALNMVIKTLSIELARRNPSALCVGLHPGTVDTALSKPFQRGVPDARLFSAARSARYLLPVLDNLGTEDSGYLYAWDGARIPF